MRSPSWLMSSTTPSATRNSASFGQAPGRERQAMLDRLRLGDLLDLPALREGELRRPATAVLRVKRAEPVGVEVTDHVPDPVLAGERHPRDRRRRPCPGLRAAPSAPAARSPPTQFHGARSAPAAGPHHHQSHEPAGVLSPAQSRASAPAAEEPARQATRANVTCYGTSVALLLRPERGPGRGDPRLLSGDGEEPDGQGPGRGTPRARACACRRFGRPARRGGGAPDLPRRARP